MAGIFLTYCWQHNIGAAGMTVISVIWWLNWQLSLQSLDTAKGLIKQQSEIIDALADEIKNPTK